MSSQVDIDTSTLSEIEFSSVCEMKLRDHFQDRIVYVCDHEAYAVCNMHTTNGCVKKSMLICKTCLDTWKSENCWKCDEPYIYNWMVI